MLTRRAFIQATPVALGSLAAVSCSSEAAKPQPPVIGRSTRAPRPGNDEGVATLDLGRRQSLRILQITDNHFFGGVEQGLVVTDADRATEKDWLAHVRLQKPDLVVASGDLWHDNPGDRGQKTLEHVLPKLAALDVPWAFTWGNHDQLGNYQAGHDALESAQHSLYRGGASHGDYRIEIHGADQKPVAHLFLMNSHQFGLAAWQLAWLRRTQQDSKARGTGTLPTLAFFHIPLLDQSTLFQSGVTKGVQGEKVCNEAEDGSALPVLAESGAMRACFCGHDHVNDYAVRGHNLDLVYGRATGYAGYGGDKVRKGAKLIEFDLATGAYSQVTVFADGTTWKPA
ncbi:MAG: metallophosphoesterase family protein [Verrucomicrobiales bacterium]|nr:metallophosphoesterase family protein [Verrucomicrobiales bacterium]